MSRAETAPTEKQEPVLLFLHVRSERSGIVSEETCGGDWRKLVVAVAVENATEGPSTV